MSRDQWLMPVVIGGGAVAAFALLGERKARASTSAPSHTNTAIGPPLQSPSPDSLYIDDDLEALARIIASEVGRGPRDEQLAIAWLARNRARRRRQSISRMNCQPCGKQGNPRPRPFSSAQPATRATRELAAIVLASPDSDDPTNGAYAGFEPALQDRLSAEGRAGHRLNARAIRIKWLRSMDYYGTVGRWDLFGAKGGLGARPVPASWGIGVDAVAATNRAPGAA